MENIIIILFIIVIIIYLIYMNSKNNELELFTNEPSAINSTKKYPVGFCNEVYSPNKKNFSGTTDCGVLEVYNDWIANGGQCPPEFNNNERCGSGCRMGYEPYRCATPYWKPDDKTKKYSIVDYKE
jgi:hypothetical protein